MRVLKTKFKKVHLKVFKKNAGAVAAHLAAHGEEEGHQKPLWLHIWDVTLWNSWSPCRAASVAERLYLHCLSSWLALDKENQRRFTPALARNGWVQWALHNLLRCCSLLPQDGAAQKGFRIKSCKGSLIQLFVQSNLAQLQPLHDCQFILSYKDLCYISQNILSPSISQSLLSQARSVWQHLPNSY